MQTVVSFNLFVFKVLCLHLKRFKFQAFHRSKVDTYVQFPVRGLDMGPYCMQDQVKRLL